jgi:hypothetical protein
VGEKGRAPGRTSAIKKKKKVVGCLQLIPVILATQEAEIRWIVVQSQPREIVLETLSLKALHTHSHTKKVWCSDIRCKP